MAITLIIKGTPIEIPENGASPSWGAGIIEALQNLTDAVNAVTGTYDIQPQVQNIDANNNSTDVTIANLAFPPAEVRGATIYYSVNRVTEDSGPGDQQEVSEAGTISVVYNSSNPVNNKWEIAVQSVGDGQIEFSITDLGQLQFTTTPLTGINHTGKLSFRAVAVLNE